jgi:P-type conjugative transfer protein TrbJ
MHNIACRLLVGVPATLTTGLLGLMLTGAPSVKAGGIPVPFATELTQLLNYATLLKQLVQQIQSYQVQFQHLQQSLIDGQLLTQFQFTPVQTDLVNLSQAVQNSFGQAYSLSVMDQQFNQLYQPFVPPGTNLPYYTQYQNWYYGTMGIIQGALQRAGVNAQALNSQQGIINQIKQMATSSVGRDQAIQVGNLVSSAMLDQLQKLQMIATDNMQRDAAIAGYDISKDQANEAASTVALDDVQRNADPTSY